MSKTKHQPEVKTEFSQGLKAHLLKALETDPKFSEAHFQLALMYKKDEDHKAAERYFRKAIKSDSHQILALEKRGKNLLKKCQFQHAKRLFLKAQEKKHHCARVNIQLSDIYNNQNKLVKAKTCLEHSIQLNPASSKAYRNLAILLLLQKNYNAARLNIEKALDLDYTDCLSHLNLGMIMKQNKDYKDAELHFLIALYINPKYVACMLEISHLHLIMKNQMEAKKYYQKAREISPNIKHAKLDKILG